MREMTFTSDAQRLAYLEIVIKLLESKCNDAIQLELTRAKVKAQREILVMAD